MALRIPIVSDWASAQQAFDFIAGKFPLKAQDIANKAISNTQLAQPYTRGTVSLVFTASTTSAAATITHGLPLTPVAFALTPITLFTSVFVIYVESGTVTSTQFQIYGQSAVSLSATVPCTWVAYG